MNIKAALNKLEKSKGRFLLVLVVNGDDQEDAIAKTYESLSWTQNNADTIVLRHVSQDHFNLIQSMCEPIKTSLVKYT